MGSGGGIIKEKYQVLGLEESSKIFLMMDVKPLVIGCNGINMVLEVMEIPIIFNEDDISLFIKLTLFLNEVIDMYGSLVKESVGDPSFSLMESKK